jgi:hypothetical protein
MLLEPTPLLVEERDERAVVVVMVVVVDDFDPLPLTDCLLIKIRPVVTAGAVMTSVEEEERLDASANEESSACEHFVLAAPFDTELVDLGDDWDDEGSDW